MTEEKKDNCELQSAQKEVAKNAGYDTWGDLIEQNEHDHSYMRGHWKEVARLLSYRVQDFRMAFEPWGKVIEHVQHNHPPGIKLGSSIAEFVLKLMTGEIVQGGAPARWIKVTNALPAPCRGYVLVYGDGEFDLAEYNGLIWRKGLITALSGITHWMPFDYPEKEEAEIITKGL